MYVTRSMCVKTNPAFLKAKSRQDNNGSLLAARPFQVGWFGQTRLAGSAAANQAKMAGEDLSQSGKRKKCRYLIGLWHQPYLSFWKIFLFEWFFKLNVFFSVFYMSNEMKKVVFVKFCLNKFCNNELLFYFAIVERGRQCRCSSSMQCCVGRWTFRVPNRRQGEIDFKCHKVPKITVLFYILQRIRN